MNKNVLTIALTVILATAVIAVGVYAYRGWQAQKGNDAINNQPTDNQLIGGQADDHGCLVAAGYSWCEAKQKCLRPWEEACDANADTEGEKLDDADVAGIKQAFMDKYAKSADEVQVTVNQAEGDYARGSVKFAPIGEPGEGGIFLAYKENNIWKLAFDGNGMYSCAIVSQYGFPADMIPDCAYPDPGTLNSTGLANPAAVYCQDHGGAYQTVTADDGSQSGICRFGDGSECDEWAFYRGECQPE